LLCEFKNGYLKLKVKISILKLVMRIPKIIWIWKLVFQFWKFLLESKKIISVIKIIWISKNIYFNSLKKMNFKIDLWVLENVTRIWKSIFQFWKLLFESENCYFNSEKLLLEYSNIYLNMTFIFEFWKKLFESKNWYFNSKNWSFSKTCYLNLKINISILLIIS
jgi:hypothetical protein